MSDIATLRFWSRLPSSVRKALTQAGISSTIGMVLRFPLRYENWESPQKISTLRNGQNALVEGVVADAKTVRWRGGRRQIITQIEDDEGGLLYARFFNANPGLERALAVGGRLRVMGAVKFGRGWEMTHPKIQFARAPGKMQAVYGSVGGISQERQRRIISEAINALQWPETTLEKFRKFKGGEHAAEEVLSLIHSPPPDDEETVSSLQNGTHPAWRRLRFDELLAHQIVLRSRRRKRERQRAVSISPPEKWDVGLRESLPFTLTEAQQKAVTEICSDIEQPRPMRRLLQGDVGSGKTAVAAFACLATAKCGKVAVLMAPTEILARQHYETLSSYFASSEVQCELLTGTDKSGQRRDALARMRFGLSQVAIGTHALFYEEERLPPPALAVIDEQHRFGVEQRRALLAGGTSHQLMMSATPIPRTLAMSAFADTDMSVLDELPPGRKPVSTILVPCHRREEVLERINKQTEGAAYWVCPRVEESDGLQDVFSLLEQVQRDYPQLSPQVLHGRMPAGEKQSAIDMFRAGKSRFLAATTVIEVGVDVPQADIMVVEHAERMGLSQLHQLRGRVGRGGREGVCILLYADDLSEEAKTRLKILRETTDGFSIAEQDLRLRGPGEWLGKRQSGMPPLRIARVGEDSDLISAAGKAAEWMLDNDKTSAAKHIRQWLTPRHRPAH